ncbi:MAG: hypothetical protein AAF208_03575 [Cyanobacteria bacterium P01_A01_bin.45]
MLPQGKLEPPPQDLIQPLLGLRDHYARLVKEYEVLYESARSQLLHVEALLATSSENNGISNGHQPLELKDISHRRLVEESLTITTPTNISQTNVSQTSITQASITKASITGELSPDSSDAENEKDQTGKEIDVSNSIELDSSSVNDVSENINTSVAPRISIPKVHKSNQQVPDIPMVNEFQNLTRMQAIEKLLHDHVGGVCHIDFIVRSLYGDLEPNLFKVVKGRVQSSLTHGKEKSYWAAVPEEPGCYTFDLDKLPSKKGKGKSKGGKKNQRKPFVLPKTRRIPMLPIFDGKFLIDAISILLEENSGKVFTVAEIISGLYGELDEEQLREIKSAVLNELSRGYRIGRFDRVPDKIGCYTWNVENIVHSSSKV